MRLAWTSSELASHVDEENRLHAGVKGTFSCFKHTAEDIESRTHVKNKYQNQKKNQKKQRPQKKQRNFKRADECASALSENTKRRDIVVSRHAIHTCTFMQLQKLVSVHSSCRRMADAQQRT